MKKGYHIRDFQSELWYPFVLLRNTNAIWGTSLIFKKFLRSFGSFLWFLSYLTQRHLSFP